MDTRQKTIVDILLEKNRLTQTEAARFDREMTNVQIEQILRQEKLVSSEDIAKSYAVLYDLPFIRLENYDVSQEALGLIDKATAEKYSIVTFQKEQSRVKMALGNPSLFKKESVLIEELKKKKGLSIDFYITTPEDIKIILNRFIVKPVDASVVEISSIAESIDTSRLNNIKTVDLKSEKIPYEVISKFPIDICKKYNIVVFASPSQHLIKVALSDPLDKKVEEILDFVREKNNVAVEEFVAPPQDINDAIKTYYHKEPVNNHPSFMESIVKPITTHIPRNNYQHDSSVKPPAEPQVQNLNKPAVQPVSQPAVVPPAPVENKNAPMPVSNPILEKPAGAKPRFVRRPPDTEIKEKPKQEINRVVTSTQTSSENDLDVFLGKEIKSLEALTEIARTGQVPMILAATVALAVAKKASDIHIEPEDEFLRIRFRIDGVLRDIIKMPLELEPAIISRVKILSRLKIDEQRVPQDGRFDVRTQNHEIDLRVSTLPTVRGEKAALRILDKSQSIYSFQELGFAGTNLKLLEENIIKPFGIVLATGPTDSGKTTTLYSVLKKISNPQVNVITLEDPVEYEMPGINQCQVKPKIGFSFAEGLRSVLRQDPNIIMVGEIRDAETAGLATHAALTGHLVLSSLHTNDAASALPRLINMGIEPFLITSSINLIVAQRLVRKLCDKCRRQMQMPAPLKEEIERELAPFNLSKPYTFYENAGCNECDQGFSGRIGIYELLAMSDAIEELAIARRPSSEIKDMAIKAGMVTMKQDGLIKAVKGQTTIAEVLRVTTNE